MNISTLQEHMWAVCMYSAVCLAISTMHEHRPTWLVRRYSAVAWLFLSAGT